MNTEEYLNSCIGRTEDGNGKSEITISLVKLNKKDNSIETISTRTAHNAALYMYPRENLTCVDMEWPSQFDAEIPLIWNIFEKYQELLNEYEQAKDMTAPVPLCQVIILSKEKVEDGYIDFWNPEFWNLISPNAATRENRILRMMAVSDTFSITEVNKNDVTQEKAAVMRTRDI